MNTQDLKQWMADPSKLNRDSMMDLKATLEVYPCFTVARVLYLKNLLNLNDLKLSSELIRTAVSVPDRRRLYFFMEGKKMPEYRVQPSAGLLETGGFSLVDNYLKSTNTQEEKAAASPTSKSNSSTSEPLSSTTTAEPVFVERSGIESNAALIDYSRYLLNQPELDQSVDPMEGQDLIDRFLEGNKTKEPAVKPRPVEVKRGSNEVEESADSVRSILDNLDFHLPEDSFTETLARIYLKQKRYDRAVEIFRSLCLKYPEKSSYFADQIRFLEKLIANLKQ